MNFKNTINVLILFFLIIFSSCGNSPLFNPRIEKSAEDRNYALSAILVPNEKIKVALSSKIKIKKDHHKGIFPGAINNGSVIANDDTLLNLIEHPRPDSVTPFRMAYNYYSDSVITESQEKITIKGIIESDTLIGKTTVPGDFGIISYKNGKLRWNKSEYARAYIVEINARKKEKDDNYFQFPILEATLIKESVDIQSAIKFQTGGDTSKIGDSLSVNIKAIDKNYYMGRQNEVSIAGMKNGYGIVGSYNKIDTIIVY